MDFDSPPPEPLASAVGYLLSWAGRRTAHRFAQTLEPLGLRPPHFGVMQLVEASPGLTQRELVAKSLVDPSSMVGVIDELEEMGLAERRANPDDRRKHAIYLTAKGKRKLDTARSSALEMINEELAPLDAHERETLRLLLRKLARVEPAADGS